MFEILNYLNDHKLFGIAVIALLAWGLMRLATSNVRRVRYDKPEPRINRFLRPAPVVIDRR